MNTLRTIGFFVASFALVAPLSALATEAAAQSESLQYSESDLGVESVESSAPMSTNGGERQECRPLLQSCSVNSQCCANLCLLGLCL